MICRLCGGSRTKEITRPHSSIPPVLVCRNCGLRFIGRILSQAEYAERYNDTEAYGNYVALEWAELGAAGRRRRWLASIGRHVRESGRPLRLLDVGCGSGDFLADARSFGFEIEGLELSSAAAQIALRDHGIRLTRTAVEDYQPTHPFDVVTSFGVLEHVLDPLALLRHMARLTAPDGIILVYTPAWCLYDRIAAMLSRAGEPRFLDRRINGLSHVQIFPRRTLVKAVDGLGMQPVETRQVCEYNLPVEAYLESMRITGKVGRAAARAVKWIISRDLFFRNNQYILARKPAAS